MDSTIYISIMQNLDCSQFQFRKILVHSMHYHSLKELTYAYINVCKEDIDIYLISYSSKKVLPT